MLLWHTIVEHLLEYLNTWWHLTPSQWSTKNTVKQVVQVEWLRRLLLLLLVRLLLLLRDIIYPNVHVDVFYDWTRWVSLWLVIITIKLLIQMKVVNVCYGYMRVSILCLCSCHINVLSVRIHCLCLSLCPEHVLHFLVEVVEPVGIVVLPFFWMFAVAIMELLFLSFFRILV